MTKVHLAIYRPWLLNFKSDFGMIDPHGKRDITIYRPWLLNIKIDFLRLNFMAVVDRAIYRPWLVNILQNSSDFERIDPYGKGRTNHQQTLYVKYLLDSINFGKIDPNGQGSYKALPTDFGCCLSRLKWLIYVRLAYHKVTKFSDTKKLAVSYL